MRELVNLGSVKQKTVDKVCINIVIQAEHTVRDVSIKIIKHSQVMLQSCHD